MGRAKSWKFHGFARGVGRLLDLTREAGLGRRMTTRALGLAPLLVLALACSRTVPDTQWPPPGPSDGLPTIPAKEDDEDDSEPASGDDATDQPAPVDGSLPRTPGVSLEREASCSAKLCRLDGWLPDPAFARSVPTDARGPAAIWLHRIAGGSSVTLPRHGGLHLFVVNLDGRLALRADDENTPRELDAWHGAHVPGCGATLIASEDATVLVALTSEAASLGAAIAKTPKEVRWQQRAAPLATFDFAALESHTWGGGAFHARIAVGGDSPPRAASFETLLASPAASIAEHDHPTWEHIAILDGEGTMKLGDTDHPVRPGAVFHIPIGLRHAFSSARSRPLLAVQLYTPSGPEQRFVKLAAAEPAR